MRKRTKRAALLMLALAMLLACVPVYAEEGGSGFSDVPEDAWYLEELNKVMWAQEQLGGSNIISGYAENGVPTGCFGPDDSLTRGQFLKMILESEMSFGAFLFTTDKSRDSIHWAGKYYTLALENNILVADVYATGGDPMFECSFESLEAPITRYEMAVILNNIETNIDMQQTVIVNEPEQNITDYDSMPEVYRHAVEQSYGKGLLTGDEGHAFNGENSLTRAEGVTVLYRYLFGCEMAEFAELPEVSQAVRPEGFVSFAERYKSMTLEEQRTALFGDPNKSYFTSATDAAGYMETVTIPIWTMDKTGNKFASSMPVTVHKLVAQEVQLIFQEIFDDPERFPIYGGWSVGGARFTDTLRHSWGCAIDVNALYNCECTINWNSMNNTVTCGYGWWPTGTTWTAFAGSLSSPSPYSISADSSVVRAFANYGWGWGGQGYGVYSDGRQKFDYMHFSILSSGG